ncbi:hypothetical protein AL486_17645 [Pandoraea apista]|nr:hypothetical protein AL486_17645 [Pandoraea apista]
MTRRRADTAIRRHGDTATRRHGDIAARRHSSMATSRQCPDGIPRNDPVMGGAYGRNVSALLKSRCSVRRVWRSPSR